MRKRYLEDWIFYWIALAFKGIFQLFPYKLGVLLGASLIYSVASIYKRRFDVAYLNLKSAFPNYPPSKLKRIIKKSTFNLSLSLMEFLLSLKLGKEDLLKFVQVNGLERLREASGGVIFLTAHYDNWELLSLVGAALGYPSFVIAREQKYPRLNSLLNRHRSRWGCVVVEKGLSLRKALKALRENKCIGILADQNAGDSGIQVKLFGKFASTNPGFIELARRTNTAVYPVFLKRIGYLRHQLNIHPRLNLDRSDQEILQEYNDLLESYIREAPEQWLWFHKRWKHSANKSILLISDGKAGHYKQARVVANILKDLLQGKMERRWNLSGQDLVRIKEVEVHWRSKFRRGCLSLGVAFSDERCQGCMRCLRWALDEGSYKELVNDKFDFIISAGAKAVPVNILLSYENSAFNINILSPGRHLLGKFKLLLLPRHDELKAKNAVFFRGAIAEKDIERAVEFVRRSGIKLDESAIKIGFLIGENLDEGIWAKLVDVFDTLNEGKGLNLLLTTSRRTKPRIEELIMESLKGKPYLRLCIIANRDNPVGAYEAILHLSQKILVTPDSISMISEALTYGKEVLILKVFKPLKSKHERFIRDLVQSGLAELVEEGNLNPRVLEPKGSKVNFDNIAKIEKALVNIL